jgi:hypothetical protein
MKLQIDDSMLVEDLGLAGRPGATGIRRQMDKVREQSRLASAKLDELSTAAEGSWDKMVADMEKLRNAFTSSFHYFKSQV